MQDTALQSAHLMFHKYMANKYNKGSMKKLLLFPLLNKQKKKIIIKEIVMNNNNYDKKLITITGYAEVPDSFPAKPIFLKWFKAYIIFQVQS